MSELVDELAEELHAAWAAYRQRRFGVVSPRWFALRHECKEHWRDVAQQTLELGTGRAVPEIRASRDTTDLELRGLENLAETILRGARLRPPSADDPKVDT